jgi:hypothetical protein
MARAHDVHRGIPMPVILFASGTSRTNAFPAGIPSRRTTWSVGNQIAGCVARPGKFLVRCSCGASAFAWTAP